MSVKFKITAIENHYNHLFNLTEAELLSNGLVKLIVDEKPGYPCRVSLEDADIGEEVILLPYQHHKTKSPYQSSGPIFVRKNARKSDLGFNKVPTMLLHRLLSLRVYDKQGMMINAKTIEGRKLRDHIEEIFKNKLADYIHVHNSSPGCFNCQINRT